MQISVGDGHGDGAKMRHDSLIEGLYICGVAVIAVVGNMLSVRLQFWHYSKF